LVGVLGYIHEIAVFESPRCRAIFPLFTAHVQPGFAEEPFLSEDWERRLMFGAVSGLIEDIVAPPAAVSELYLSSGFLAIAVTVIAARASFAASVVAGVPFVIFGVSAPWALFVIAHAGRFV